MTFIRSAMDRFSPNTTPDRRRSAGERVRVRQPVRPAATRKNRADGAARDDFEPGARRCSVSAREPRPSAGRPRLPRSSELSARQGPRCARSPDALNSADEEISLEGKGAVLGTRLRLCDPADRAFEAARQHFGDRQSQKLDRPARHFHTAHHRQIGCLRPRGARL